VPHEKLFGKNWNWAVSLSKEMNYGLAGKKARSIAYPLIVRWRFSAQVFVKVARKARIPLYLSFAQRKQS
jgi:hypothetical protein